MLQLIMDLQALVLATSLLSPEFMNLDNIRVRIHLLKQKKRWTNINLAIA